MFNLKVRELKRQEALERTGASSPRSRPGHNSTLGGGGGQGHGFDLGLSNQRRRGPTFWDLQTILYNEFIHQIVPQQLKWIGRSGERDRCAVPPMMATSAPRDPVVLTRQVNAVHNQRQRKDADYRAVQEEKWFAAAQRRFHSIAQHE